MSWKGKRKQVLLLQKWGKISFNSFPIFLSTSSIAKNLALFFAFLEFLGLSRAARVTKHIAACQFLVMLCCRHPVAQPAFLHFSKAFKYFSLRFHRWIFPLQILPVLLCFVTFDSCLRENFEYWWRWSYFSLSVEGRRRCAMCIWNSCATCRGKLGWNWFKMLFGWNEMCKVWDENFPEYLIEY